MDQGLLNGLEARVNALNARYNRTKQGLNDFLTTNTRLHGELMANGVDPRDRRWWTRYDTSRDKMVNELRAKKAALALKKEIVCSPPPPPRPMVAVTPPPAPLPLCPSIDPLGWPAMPPHFCSWADYRKFTEEQISPRYNKAAENAGKAARFRTQVEVQVNDLVQADKPIPPTLAALRRQAIADVAEQNRLFKESEEIYRRAKAIPVIDCRSPVREEPPRTAPPSTGTATNPVPHVQSGSPLDPIRNRLFAIAEAMEAANDRCDPENYERLLNELREMRSQLKLAAAVAIGAAEFSNVNPREAEDLADALREVIRQREWQLHDLGRKCRPKVQGEAAAPSQTGFIPPPNSIGARILDVHNKERAAVGARPLQWDPALAAGASAYAQQLARGGAFVHSPRAGRENERENLTRGLPGASAERMMVNWTREKSNFIPGTYPNVSRTGSWYDVSHYTQMIWPTTTRVGCGTASGAGQEVMVCRYTPPGNRDGKPVIAAERDPPPETATPVNPRDIPKLPVGGGMTQIDPPPPPPPTARDDAPQGDEARHPLVTHFNNAFNQHGTETDCGNETMARLELENMRYALDELKKRLKAARKAGPFSAVKPEDVQRQIDELDRKIRFAEQRRRGDICPPEWRPPPPPPPPTPLPPPR